MKNPLPARCRRGSPSGFALICVLALVCLAALSTTAFLANSRLERLSARTIGDQTRLDLALTFGANLSLGQMSKTNAAWNWITFLRGEDSNGVGYLFAGIPYTGNVVANLQQWTCFPLFSPANVTNIDATNPIPVASFEYTIPNQASFANTNGNSGLNPTTNYSGNTVRIPLMGFRTSPPVGWITNKIVNSKGASVPISRFAYFTEDVEGLFQADRMGGTTNRSTGTNAEEISLLGMGISNAGAISDFTNARGAFLSPGMMAAVFSNQSSLKPLLSNAAYFATGTRAMNGNSPDVSSQGRAKDHVPLGLGYAGGNSNLLSTNKMNLNNYLGAGNKAQNVSAIANWIGNNLPNFASARAGGFIISGGGATNTNAYTTNAYLQTLAANIIDYADVDSDPTTDGTGISTNRDRPAYRGVDSCPWVNEYVTRFNLFSTNATNVGGVAGRAIIIQTDDYVELWNPCDKTNSGTLSFIPINRQPFTAGFSSFNFTNPLWATNAKGATVLGGVSSNSTNVTLNPNQFLVIGLPTVTNCFFYPATNLTLPLTLPDDINSSYRVAWNNTYYDAALGGLRRQNKILKEINDPKWSGTCPGFVGENLSSTFWNMSGDPRATIYQAPPQSSISYDTRSSFGGRNYRSGLTANPYGEVKPSLWPDGGHDSPPGQLPPSGVNSPPTSTPPAAYTNCPPARISDSGFYSNICELGNIFDPIQWYDNGGTSTTTGYGSDGGQWANLTPTAVASNVYGGGTSLRIGRPELGKFAWTNMSVGSATVPQPNMQASAAALLDLFCTSDTYDDGGKINLNTAPPLVLRALASGIVHTNDASILPGSMKTSVVPSTAVDAFVKGVTNFRAQYPFLSSSQLSFIWTNAGLPNTNSWPTNGAVFGNASIMQVAEWNDAAAEEWFSKIYGLSKVGSRNLRVYCVAQLLNTNGSPAGGVVRRYFELTAQQNNDNPPMTNSFISGQAPY